jgi:hypothetical protein
MNAGRVSSVAQALATPLWQFFVTRNCALGGSYKTERRWVTSHERQQVLIPPCGGSNPPAPASQNPVSGEAVYEPRHFWRLGPVTDRAVPAHAEGHGVQVRLEAMELHRPRQWGACWLVCQLYEQLGLDQFWASRLPDSHTGRH